MGQQERTGEEDESEREIDDEDQRGHGGQREIGETELRDRQEMEIEAQGERVESERGEIEVQEDQVERLEMEEQEERVESERGEIEVQEDQVERREMEEQEDFEELALMETEKQREQAEEMGKKEIEAKKKVVAANRKSTVKISAKRTRKRSQNNDDAHPYHSTLDIFPVQYVSKTREKKMRSYTENILYDSKRPGPHLGNRRRTPE
ncbi:uncharacterized protein DDB_G0283697 isoform X2 [Carassius gibelio]|uniref:uncharacterized protein DDB_G0283697 isoform X2 n=1 Tax=Carassius gibelio TaxID=101364 RepID=UPI0022776080|nr:uncharacterized protein DDB_G0283697 isoform X2 [Carassius gibelio]